MRTLVTFLLMISLLSMTVATASAGPSAPSCSSQLRADDMCYAAALPTASAEKGKAGGICCEMFPPADGAHLFASAGQPVGLETRRLRMAGGTVPHWRPPRA